MQTISSSIWEGIRNAFGDPASIRRVLATHPRMRASLRAPARTISARNVPSWHELGTPPLLGWPRRAKGHLVGWTASGGDGWQSFHIVRPEYARLARCQITQATLDLQAIDGFAASKSDLNTFASTDEMVVSNSRELIAEISLQQLAKALAHREIRIIHSPGADHFARYLWDVPAPRLWLMNSGGSHHLAAAKLIAARLGQSVSLTGDLHTHSLDASAVASLRAEFELFALADDDVGMTAFADAMRAVRATWLSHPLPRPYERSTAVLLPRSEGRSMRVALEMRKAGMTDLGEHLSALATALD